MSDAPPPPTPLRSGDGWVELPDGRRFWGRAGAAGLLAVAPSGAVLLQERVGWSHFGGTWGLPGGARDLDESALHAAMREAREETGIDTVELAPRFAVRLDLGVWSYTTVAADASTELPVAVADRESTALAWVPAHRVADRALHPGFGEAWPALQALLDAPTPVLVVDAANVVGSRPDGWWRDRPGAAQRLLAALARLATDGVPQHPDGAGQLPVVARWPRIVVVLEGQARAAIDEPGLEVVRAEHDGDSAIVGEVERAVAASGPVTAVTADRALQDRVRAAGGDIERPSHLLHLLG